MTLRKKVASSVDDSASIPRAVVVSEKGEDVVTEEINCEICTCIIFLNKDTVYPCAEIYSTML